MFDIFLTGTFAGFVGSIQPGPVNSSVVLHTVNNQYRTAILIALSGSIVQGFGAVLAYVLWVNYNNYIPSIKSEYVGVIFLALASYYIFFYENKIENEGKSDNSGLAKGFFLALLNPQIIPYWMFVLSFISKINNNLLAAVIFGISAGIGTFSILFLVSKIAKYFDVKFSNANYKYVLATMFLLFGLFKCFIVE